MSELIMKNFASKIKLVTGVLLLSPSLSCVTSSHTPWANSEKLVGFFVTDCSKSPTGGNSVEALYFSAEKAYSQTWNYEKSDNNCKGKSLEFITRSQNPVVYWISDEEFIMHYSGEYEDFAIVNPGESVQKLFQGSDKLQKYPETIRETSIETGILPTFPKPNHDCFTRAKTADDGTTFVTMDNPKTHYDCFQNFADAKSAEGKWNTKYYFKESNYSVELRFRDISEKFEKALSSKPKK